MSPATPVVVDKDGGEAVWFGGGRVVFKVTAGQADGEYAIIHDRMPRGKTTPLHLHETFDETMYVISGELLVHLDGKEYTAGAGSVASMPRGVPHAFLVTSEESEIIAIATPGDVFERFVREGGEPAQDGGEIPPLDIEKVKTAGERTGAMRVLGPPPFAAVTAGR